MEKFINLGHAYSSVNTVTGEICYMVDSALYKDILLAVAARKQNEQILIAASERMEQHIEQIAGSNERIMQREKHAIEQMAHRMNESHLLIQDEHRTRMTNVMTDIRALRDSLACSTDHEGGSRDMQRLQFDVHRYENVIPVYLARIKDAEKANQDFFGNSGNPLRASNI
jgi:murein L,D-transpeptidase YcbB/YkuD